MTTRPYRLLGASQLARVAAAGREALGRWRGAWFVAGADACVEARAADRTRAEHGDAAPLVRAADGARWAAVLAGPDAYRAAATRFAAQVGDGWSARGELTPVLRGALEECFGALAEELLAPARAQPSALVEIDAAWRAGSGAAALELELEGARFAALLSPALVYDLAGAARPSPRGGLARRIDCIQGRTIGLQVTAGSADLGIGSLVSIAPGDVLVLDARIDQTFALTGAGGTPLARGFLGSRAGSKALQLVN
ncbi:MAG TPA: FliM/FliN family flagellar motor switch protein [Burkholderiales bacterium]|nr:FliM/FliN family flagellar motor switch protein [Burkholderiales bacterium]